MPPVTADEILKQITDLQKIMQDNNKSVEERLEEAKRAGAEQLEAKMSAFRREFVSANGPMTEEQGRVATQKGGIFEGRFQLGYQKMLDLPTSNPALLPRDKERLKAIQDLHDAMVIRYFAAGKKLGDRATKTEIMKEMEKSTDFQLYAAQLVNAGYAKAANDILNPAGGTGVNLDFTLLSSQLIDLVRLSAVVAAQFRRVPLTRAKQEFPALRADTKSVLGSGLTTYPVPANDPASVAAFPQSTMLVRPSYGQVAFSCVHNLGAIAYTDDMVEDSVVPFLPQMREQGAIMLARGEDAAIINGDTQATHIDTDVTATFDIRKAWNGLRRLGMNNELDVAGPIASSHFNSLMQLLGKYATNPGELVMFLNVIDWLKLAADTNLNTVEKIGIDRATLRTGVINQVSGVNIVVTEEIRRDLDIDGEFDGAPTDNTIEILCNTTRFWLGQKGETKVEEVRVPQALGSWLQVDVREDFKPLDIDDTVSPLIFPTGGSVPVAIAVNVTI